MTQSAVKQESQKDELLAQAGLVIKGLRERLSNNMATRPEPIAIIGMACRFPGSAEDVEAFWRMIQQRGDAVGPVPAERLGYEQTATMAQAALLREVDKFDPGFFGISPREAQQMDPQQRIFLEVAWDALEDGGQTKEQLAGSDTGVFVAVHNHSNGYFLLQAADAANFNEFTGHGSGQDVIAGRLSYFLDLRGPTATINTACSSSLVAAHIACQSVLSGDCRMALVGGVNLILGSLPTTLVTLGGMLAPDHRCKPFDSRANGFGRGEGCGVVLLKRLSHAVADGDRILAIIRGSGVNQDGRSNGLSAPNGLAQKALIERVLERAEVDAKDVTFVEAHGTGTALGDPIEVEALAATYGRRHLSAMPCGLGSAKANIGHLEGAAGVAGLIKVVLQIREKTIPPVTHFTELNPHISLKDTRLFVPVESQRWEAGSGKRLAAVSSFGWSGTNAHMILEEPPVRPPMAERESTVPGATVVPVSAADLESLSKRVEAYAAQLEGMATPALESFAWTAGARRTHHQFRVAAVGNNPKGLANELLKRLRAGANPLRSPRIAFIYEGAPSEWRSVGDDLIETEPVFRSAIQVCVRAFQNGDTPGVPELPLKAPGVAADPKAAAIWLFFAQMALTRLFASWGIVPSVTKGYGLGQLAARCEAGTSTISEAASAIWHDNFRETATSFNQDDLGDADVAVVFGAATATLETLSRKSLVYCLDEGSGERSSVLKVVAALYESGAAINWRSLYSPQAQLVSLPSYPYRRRRYWIASSSAVATTPETTSRDGLDEAVPDDWLYQLAWTEQARHTSAIQSSSSRPFWVILDSECGTGDRFGEHVRASGDKAIVVRRGAGFASTTADRFTVDPNSISPLLQKMGDLTTECQIVCFWPLDAVTIADTAAAAEALCTSVTRLFQSMLQHNGTLRSRLWIVTRGAVLGGGDGTAGLSQAPLWGWGGTAGIEHTEAWGGLVDLDPVGMIDEIEELRAELSAEHGENQIALRREGRLVARLRRMAKPNGQVFRLRADRTYVVAGAFGGIGPLLAGWLTRRGARHLLLIGRSSASTDPGTRGDRMLRELKAGGVSVRTAVCDVADLQSLTAVLADCNREMPPMGGVFHAAADIGVDSILDLTGEKIAKAFRPKVAGALNLDRLTRGLPLDFFVLFSSAVAVTGARAHAAYSAANSFLDAVAEVRRRAGLQALSVSWGLWGGREFDASTEPALFNAFFEPMRPETALSALGHLLSTGAGDCVVASFDWPILRPALQIHGRASFISELDDDESSESRTVETLAPTDLDPMLQRLQKASVAERQGMLVDLVSTEARGLLELTDDDTLDPDRGFFDLGMDSLMTLQLKARMEKLSGLALPGMITMTHSSVTQMAAFLCEALSHAKSDGPPKKSHGDSTLADFSGDAVHEPDVALLSDAEVRTALDEELKQLRIEAGS